MKKTTLAKQTIKSAANSPRRDTNNLLLFIHSFNKYFFLVLIVILLTSLTFHLDIFSLFIFILALAFYRYYRDQPLSVIWFSGLLIIIALSLSLVDFQQFALLGAVLLIMHAFLIAAMTAVAVTGLTIVANAYKKRK